MNTLKPIGIFMDYYTANIMELSERPHEIQTIKSKFDLKLKKEKNKSENYLYTLAQQCKADYFKKIASTILQYDRVLLFGPTKAKTELFNILKQDSHFFKIKTYLKETGRLTRNKRNKFIHEHFTSLVYESN